MRIMFCLGSMTKGGAERVVANLANDFARQNDIAIVVTPPDASSYELNKKITFKTLDSFEDKKKNVLLRTIRRIKKLKIIIKDFNPNIIVSLLPEPSFRVMLATFFHRRKVIISVRNDPKVEYNNTLKKLLVKILYERADGFIFQTADAQKFFSNKVQKKSVIIPNPIADEFIGKPFNGPRNNHIVTVGRLTSQKNHVLLINTFSEVVQRYPSYELHIYGDGELKEELMKLSQKLNLANKIFFEGNVDNIKNYIYKAKMFVLSSDYEGMPNALMEAMALGIPSISTDCPCGGSAFLMKNKENGILVPVNNLASLKDAMIKIIEDEDYAKKISLNANKIGSELNTKIINRQWIDYITKVLKEK